MKSIKRANNKKQAILKIATDLFLERGYTGASVNEMSRRSGISKETIYRHFKNKKDLFAAVIDNELENYQSGLDQINLLDQERDMHEVLLNVGKTILKVLLSERTMSMRRLIFHESTTQPVIGKIYYERGPQRAYNTLEKYFTKQKRKGRTSRFSSKLLSHNFISLLLHKPVLDYQCHVNRKLSNKDIETMVKKTVKGFITAYFDN